MNYWIITDTHFGHVPQMCDYCGRPENYSELILKRLNVINSNDILIHLGDICFGNDSHWHERLFSISCKRWLTLGNHDKKSYAWYLSNGWDFVSQSFTLRVYGKEILFSHVPRTDTGYDLNIHGHFHNNDHRKHEPELVAIKNDKQILLAMEFNNYQPYSLRKIAEKM